MAIFIKGKTTCRICGDVLTSGATMVGFPNVRLPVGLEEIADSCVHRSCLDSHARRDELLQAWRRSWVAQAERAPAQASVNQHCVVLFYPKRFVLAALESFVDIEEALESFDQLRAFFGSFNGSERLSTVASWNAYELAPNGAGTRLLVTRNAAPGAAFSVQDDAVLDYEFNEQRMTSFLDGWASLAKR